MGGTKRTRKRPTKEPPSTSELARGPPEGEQKPKRKRGRPRKVVVVEEGEEEEAVVEEELDGDGKKKKEMDAVVQQEGLMEPVAPSTLGDQKKEMQSEEDNKPKSRGRRKGKPHKST